MIEAWALDSLFDPGARRTLMVEPGCTVARMVELAHAGAAVRRRLPVRVTIGDVVVPEPFWRHTRPKAGAVVVIRYVPGNDVLRNVLTIAVAVGAVALGQFYGPILAGSLLGLPGAATGILASTISAGITGSALIAGTLLINALIPPQSDKASKPTYAIDGFKNQLTPDGVVPAVRGRIRQAPIYACRPYTEIVGDNHYIVAAFLHGYGPLDMSDFRIGQTPVNRFVGVQFETRAGRPDDPPLTLVTKTVLEEPQQIELFSSGPFGGPRSLFTASDVTECSVDISFPNGPVAYAKDGSKKTATCNFQVGYRLETDPVGQFTTIAVSVRGSESKQTTRSVPIVFPVRGRYEIRLWRTTRDYDSEDQSKRDTQYSMRSFWSMLRSIRPEYPIAFDKPLALSAVRILATGQLNGSLDEWNSMDGAILPDWDAPTQTWVERVTPNPASLFRDVLTGAAITFPLALDEIDEGLADWHEFCAAHRLTYNRVHNFPATVFEVLSAIAAAGRATPRDSGTKWGVVIDRALDVVSAHVSPRNSWGFQGERAFARFPDAFRVKFKDQTSDFKPAERVVPWPGFVGDVRITEDFEIPGGTDPDMIWSETRRRQYELIHRPDTYTVKQDWAAMLADRGDRVELSHDVISRVMKAAKVVGLVGNQVVLDDEVTMTAGERYGVRFRSASGASVVRSVQTLPGTVRSLMLNGPGDLPQSGAYVFFGTAAQETLSCTLRGFEVMTEFTHLLTLIDHAPEIEALVAADTPPAWNGRAGSIIGDTARVPAVPTVTSIVSGQLASGAVSDANPYPVVVALSPGDTVPLASYEVRHRPIGASAWQSAVGPVASGTVLLAGYAKGDQVEMQPRSISTGYLPSPWGATLTHVVAATDPAAPSAPQALTAAQASGAPSLTIRATGTSSADPKSAATRLYIAVGASASFSAATAYTGDQVSGPNTTLPPVDITALPNGTALAAGTYRLWATAIDGNSPPTESIPFGPVAVTLS